MDFLILVPITFLASIVNGGLGYGFSSITVPLALLFYASRILNPTLVLVEVFLNSYTLAINYKSIPNQWKRVLPLILGLIPGILVGSYFLASVNTTDLKLVTYIILIPLILLQAAGIRRVLRSEKKWMPPLGMGIGVLYSLTTISGPPLALFFNNQGLAKRDFRAALGLIRVVESVFTAIVYFFLGLFSTQILTLSMSILPSIAIGLPLGTYLIRRMSTETFRRVAMSFDCWIVSFGLSRVLIQTGLLSSFVSSTIMLVIISIDICLLFFYFKRNLNMRASMPPQTT